MAPDKPVGVAGADGSNQQGDKNNGVGPFQPSFLFRSRFIDSEDALSGASVSILDENNL